MFYNLKVMFSAKQILCEAYLNQTDGMDGFLFYFPLSLWPWWIDGQCVGWVGVLIL